MNKSSIRYCEDGPGWQPEKHVLDAERRRRWRFAESQRDPHLRQHGVGNGTMGGDDNNPFATQWTALSVSTRVSSHEAHGAGAGADEVLSVTVDLSPLRGQVLLAVRLAWPLFATRVGKADSCCTSTDVKQGLAPCVPGNCPLYSSVSELPVNPFFAVINEGKCKCSAPQECNFHAPS